MADHRAQGEAPDYYLLPLAEDLKDSVTLLRVHADHDGRVVIHLHRGIADDVVAAAQAQAHERRVQGVLDLLAGQVAEDSRARPNPDLPRIVR